MPASVSHRTEHPPALSSDEDRFAAIARRDRAADGLFVFSVRSTGVYCRPSCAARPAKRANVAFHAGPAEAESAGYRPCKRCRPDEGPSDNRHAAAIARACELIEAAETLPTLDALAAAAGLSPFHFHRLFKASTGTTPHAYAAARRAARVASALKGGGTVTEALYEAGFNAPSRFYAEAGGRLGMTPTAFRNGGAGSLIRFALGPCSLGTVLVAATERGVCAILLGDDPDGLLHDLEDRFPQATLEPGGTAFAAIVARAVGLVEAPERACDLPLDIAGTAFQSRVWAALQAIPPGRTASYAEIATAIGQPSAVRAVAGACAANPVAVAIPCHRVVRADGGLSGYRWGVARKRALLTREAAVSASAPAIRSASPRE